VIDSRLKAFRAAEPPPSEEAERAARAALARAIDQAIQPRTPRVRRVRLGIAGLVAAGAAIAVVLISVLGTPAGSNTAAAAVLNQLAELVASQSITPHTGQYLYVDSISAYPSDYDGRCITVAPDHRQIWIGANGSGLLRDTTGPAKIRWAANPTACNVVSRSTRAGGTSNTWFAAHCLALGPTTDWRRLSTNPQVLLEQMRRLDGGPRTPAEDFVHIGDFLRETDAPPAIRAAIYRATALIPGIRLLGWVRSYSGKLGLGIAYSHNGQTSKLIFNHQTGELLGEQVTERRGKLSSWAAYLQNRVVNRLPAPSPLPLTPPCVKTSGIVHHTPKGDVMVGSPKGSAPAGLVPNP
jgi:hypothetical protein